jgi:hypothetical protein
VVLALLLFPRHQSSEKLMGLSAGVALSHVEGRPVFYLQSQYLVEAAPQRVSFTFNRKD